MLRALVLAASLSLVACASASEEAVMIPAPAVDQAAPAAGSPLRKAVVAGGCFWGVQGVYQHLKGVKNVLSGYAGGDAASANYRVREQRRHRPCRSGRDRLRPRAGDATARSCRCSSRWCTIPPSSIARVPTSARSTARPSSTERPSRRRSPRPTSHSSTRRACTASRIVTQGGSDRRRLLRRRGVPPGLSDSTTRTSPTSSSTICRRCATSRRCSRRCT